MSDLAGFFTIAPSDGFYFAGTSNNDMLLYPETEQQRIHLGTKQGSNAVLVFNSNVINVHGNLETFGQITASNINTFNALTFSNTTGSLYLDSSNANLGIDYPTPEYKLDVNGDIRAVSYYLFSDIRKKTDLQLIDHAVDKLSNISGYTFTLNGQRSAGLIAQEVMSVLPEVISEDSQGFLSISYDNVIGLLVNAVKELTTRVQSLEQRLSS